MPSRTPLLASGLLASTLLFLVPPGFAAEPDTGLQDDEKLVRASGLSPDVAGLVAFFRKRTLSEADRQGLEKLIAQLGARSFAQRERASRRLEEWGAPALSYLQQATRSQDLEIARRADRCIEVINNGPGAALPAAATRILARLKPPEAVAVLLAYLPFADDATVQDEVFAALLALGQDRERQAPLKGALADPLPLRRAAAGYVLGRSADMDLRARVKKLLADESALVRLRAAQALLYVGEKAAVPALIGLLTVPAPETVWQAEDLLLRIAGEEGPVAPVSTDDRERALYRDRWLRWWEASSGKINLARLVEDPPQRGWTLIAQMSTSKVYEIDRQGKVRWSVEGLSGPIDAQILPGNRVLIAEHHGSRVTERNLQGKVLWEKRLDNRPVNVQRLPNGNTFIATYTSLEEVTRDGKVVYNYRPDGTGGRIYSGQKLRNGHLVCLTLEGRLLEMDGTNGKVLKSFSTGLNGCYSVQGLPRGGYLVASYNQGQVAELDAAGKVIWRHSYPSAYHAERLPNGHTLISSHGQSRVIEINRQGKVLSEHGTNNSNVWRVHRR
jgi:HEAT repeats/PQQ-like domain